MQTRRAAKPANLKTGLEHMQTKTSNHANAAHRRRYFNSYVETYNREIDFLREVMAPRIRFLNENKGRDNQDIRDARQRVKECRDRIAFLKNKIVRILANSR
jgi:hypothetical protein